MSDPRTTLARGDLAAAELEGRVRAGRYAETISLACAAPAAAIRRAADPAAEQMDQLLFGERFEVLEEKAGWAWGQARRDGYVGFVERAALTAYARLPTHRVSAPRAYAFSEPSIKSRPIGLYSMNALVFIEAREGRFAKAAGSGWFVENQLADIGSVETDPAAIAERYLGAAYQWGGRESLGLDCSGLVQQALLACGRACPRDTDQQAEMGAAIAAADLARGDLVFWRGHVGMMLDQTRLIHANAHHMAVAIEPLAEAVARIAAAGSGHPTAYQRI
ncbi:C40 family peptidase [Phenylobacterium montanum]|uniref:C40 family peptidase n=1 Tax=Phenylobacterium montanum TaxID=2823693 RepID=A0A975FZ81_9CAUL|nr:NlpC/P60 family protein [Caulobacter sp. S6]QUD87041.1 C40 family peptidase [Caulobacter sp. S6]